MENYLNTAKRAIEYINENKKYRTQIEAITFCLIGAMLSGKDIKSFNYDKKEIAKLEENKGNLLHIEAFQESKRSHIELETMLNDVVKQLKMNELYLSSEINSLGMHFKMCPRNFLSHYVTISDRTLIGELKDYVLLKDRFVTFNKSNKENFVIIPSTDSLTFYFKNEEDVAIVNKYFSLLGREISFEVKELSLTENTKMFLPYLYIS